MRSAACRVRVSVRADTYPPHRFGADRAPASLAWPRSTRAPCETDCPQFLWDLLFYEPWFLGLGVLVTLGALHHHRRAGGTDREARSLVILTAAATLALTALACVVVVLRNA